MKKILGLIALAALTSCGVSTSASRPVQKASTRPVSAERTTTTTTTKATTAAQQTSTQQTSETGTSKADGTTSKGRKVVKK